jgi:hypothetical protein
MALPGFGCRYKVCAPEHPAHCGCDTRAGSALWHGAGLGGHAGVSGDRQPVLTARRPRRRRRNSGCRGGARSGDDDGDSRLSARRRSKAFARAAVAARRLCRRHLLAASWAGHQDGLRPAPSRKPPGFFRLAAWRRPDSDMNTSSGKDVRSHDFLQFRLQPRSRPPSCLERG